MAQRGFNQSYDNNNMAPQGNYLYAIGNYIYDTDPWWEGIDGHGGQYVYIAYNTLINIASGISIFSNTNRGFMAYEVHVHDNEVLAPTTPTTNPATAYGNAFGGSRLYIHHNRFRNGGRAYPSDAGANVYFDRGYEVFFNDNTVDNSYGSAIFFSGEFSQCFFHDNYISQAASGAGNDPAMFKFNTSSLTLYVMYIENNSFQGGAPIVKAPATKTTSNQMIKLKNNKYNLLPPTFVNIENVCPDVATAAQIADSTCGENGDICRNAIPSVGTPIGWIMTGASHGTGTWVALPNL